MDFIEPYKIPWQNEEFRETAEDDYHSTAALSSGRIKALLQSPAHFKHAASQPYDPNAEKTPAMRFGAIFHQAMLEGPKFLKNYVVPPKFEGEGSRKAKASWLADLPQGAIVLKDQEELDQITEMMNSILAHPIAARLLSGGQRELSGFFNHRGIRCKIRIDIFQPKYDMLVDLKTTADASQSAFWRSAWDSQYPIQAAWYLLGASILMKRRMRHFSYIVVEKTPPYAVNVFGPDEAYIQAGETMIRWAMNLLLESIKTNRWPAYGEAANTLTLPPWGLRDLEDMADRLGQSLFAEEEKNA